MVLDGRRRPCWPDTPITKQIGITYPIIQGPFGGGPSSARLVAAVSNAGGLGSYGAFHLSPQQIKDVAAEIRSRTDKPFAINLWIDAVGAGPMVSPEQFEQGFSLLASYYRDLRVAKPSLPDRIGHRYEAQVEAILEAKPPVFSFVFGIPSEEVLRACRTSGIRTIGTATTVDEARALDVASVDAIVATGFEAGGHRVSFLRPPEECLMGMLALVPQVVDHVKVPVIAAGGIADARGIVAALALGAQAVQIGTAFLACEESDATAIHREKLFSNAAKDTVLTRAFTGRLARGIRTRFSDDMRAHDPALLPYPFQYWLTGTLRRVALERGRSDFVALWTGQAAPLLRARSARQLMEELVRTMPRLLEELAGGASGAPARKRRRRNGEDQTR